MAPKNALGTLLLCVIASALAIITAIVLFASEFSLRVSDAHIAAEARSAALGQLRSLTQQVGKVAADAERSGKSLVESRARLEPWLVSAVEQDKSFLYAMLVTPEGLVAAHSNSRVALETIPKNILLELTPAAGQSDRASKSGWFGEDEVVNYAVPVVLKDRSIGTLHIGALTSVLDQRMAEQRHSANNLLLVTGALCLMVVIAGVAGGWLLIRRARRLDAVAARQVQLAEVGQLASGLAHEVRNPLNAMRMQIAVARSKLRKPEEAETETVKAQLDKLEAEVLRLQGLVTDFLAYGRPPLDEPVEFEVAALIRDVTDFIRPEFEAQGILLKTDIDSAGDRAAVVMDRGKLRQVLLNLLENARQAMVSGGTATLALRFGSDRTVELSVTDTGCGIPRDKLAKVFDAFYSTKDGGNGLGLAIVKRAIESIGGTVAVDSQEGRATRFVIRIPGGKMTGRNSVRSRARVEEEAVT